ncbi:TetR/AcrR family transcriptional regulator [Microbacterium hominis]|uniref:TetR family transcriptional regulator n=1 Tax=Microbacterium hominis TaxID=162426 RepID=A0A7D4TF76_9MICO|nr:TetR family transcriptional regulator [Microbacterium hominis]QKJ18421.1 TetR family transcriptional regulator [Microbacterium hominis]
MSPSSRHPQRKAALIAAARRVAAERGLAQTNVRAVAAEADVSAGSVIYYFPTFDELIYSSVEAVLEEFSESRLRASQVAADPVDRMRILIDLGIPDEITDELRIVYESISLMREKPHYRPLMRSIVERQVMLYRTTIELGTGLGAFRPTRDPAEIAGNIVALEDSFDYYPLFGYALDREACRRAVRAYASLALDCEIEPTQGAM